MTDAYVPLTGPPTWHHAACRGEDPEMWFSILSVIVNPDGENAEDICRRCPYTGELGECADWARQMGVTDGIWGGIDMSNHKNQQPRPRCALDGCNNPVGAGRKSYCSAVCQHEAERRYSVVANRRRRQERRQAALLRP
jgi:Transcription factor WhiB